MRIQSNLAQSHNANPAQAARYAQMSALPSLPGLHRLDAPNPSQLNGNAVSDAETPLVLAQSHCADLKSLGNVEVVYLR